MKKPYAIYPGERFNARVNIITAPGANAAYEVEQWGVIDSAPHGVPFLINSWNFLDLDEAVAFAKTIEATANDIPGDRT